MADFPDLVPAATVARYLAERGLSAAELANLADLVTAASANVRTFCRRAFSAWTFDELYTVGPGDRGLTLNQFPVLSCEPPRTDPTVALSITNASTANQRAFVTLDAGGDVAGSPAPVGISLTRWTSGVKTVDPLTFAASLTLADLATAVAALGHGWAATVTPGYSLWPSVDLRAVQGGSAANGAAAGLALHATDLEFDLDERLGVLTLGPATGSGSGSGSDSPRWGPSWSEEFADVRPYGGPGGVRVVYTAGFLTVPADVVKAVVDTVQGALDRLRTDTTIQSESDGVLSWTGRDLAQLTALPLAVRTALANWINYRA